MIRMTIELVPYGIESDRRKLYTLEIANVGGTKQVGDYDYFLYDDDPFAALPGMIHRGHISLFDRDQGAMALVRRVLERVQHLGEG